MNFIDINNSTYAVKIHQRDGNLPWLLMLHGFMGDHRVFDHLIDELCKFSNPVTPDLLGYGSSAKPTDPERYQEQQQIADIHQIIESLSDGPVFLFGYSMGGRLALKSALSAPEKIAGLILESTTCGIPRESERKKRRRTDAKRAKQIEDNYDQFLSRWKELELFKSPLAENKLLADKYERIQSEQSPETLSASLRGFGTGAMNPVCEELQKFELPVMLLAGSEDDKYQRINSNMEEKFSNATFASIKAGHRTHLNNPPAFLTELKNFIINRK